jgi:hypothetical protein
MLKKFNAIYGQSNFDVCLNTYGTLDRLVQLMQDSGVTDINASPLSNQEYTYDDSLLVNKNVTQNFALKGVRYATDLGVKGSVYYAINQTVPPGFTPPPAIIIPPIFEDVSKIIATTSYSSVADGTTIFTPLDKDGLSMVGYDVIFVEKEIKPLTNSQWNWNKSLGQLTLLGGTTLDFEQTAFLLYAKTV